MCRTLASGGWAVFLSYPRHASASRRDWSPPPLQNHHGPMAVWGIPLTAPLPPRWRHAHIISWHHIHVARHHSVSAPCHLLTSPPHLCVTRHIIRHVILRTPLHDKFTSCWRHLIEMRQSPPKSNFLLKKPQKRRFHSFVFVSSTRPPHALLRPRQHFNSTARHPTNLLHSSTP